MSTAVKVERTAAEIVKFDLAQYAARINAAHEAVAGSLKTGIEHALECGRLLIEAKAKVQRGQWLPWLEANCAVRARMAEYYMTLARRSEQLNSQHVANFTIREGIAEMTKRVTVAAALPAATLSAVLEQEIPDSGIWAELKRAQRLSRLPEPASRVLRKKLKKLDEDSMAAAVLRPSFAALAKALDNPSKLPPEGRETLDAICELIDALRLASAEWREAHPDLKHWAGTAFAWVFSEIAS